MRRRGVGWAENVSPSPHGLDKDRYRWALAATVTEQRHGEGQYEKVHGHGDDDREDTKDRRLQSEGVAHAGKGRLKAAVVGPHRILHPGCLDHDVGIDDAGRDRSGKHRL